jgi:triphosphatase
MAQEIEIKLELTPAALERLEASRWLGRRARLVRREDLRSVYFDTPKLELRDRGIALRVRHVGQKRLQTIKSARPWQALARDESEHEITSDEPDLRQAHDTALAPLVTKTLRAQLTPVFETRVQRTVVPLHRKGGELELVIDRGEISAGGGLEPISEVEVELKGGQLGALVQLAKTLGDEFELRYGLRSKAERGYALLEKTRAKAARAEDVALPRNVSVAAGFQIIGLACLRHFALNEQPLQSGDTEAVHQMRVGLRRLRAAISLFEDMLDDEETQGIKAQLRWLTDQLGPARDYDVLLEESVTPLRESGPHQPELQKLESLLCERRAVKLAQAMRAVASDRYRKLVLETALWLLGGDWLDDTRRRRRRLRERSLESLASEQLARRTKQLGKKLRRLERLDPDQRHKLRIAVKKLHYGTEFFAALFPARASRRKRFVKRLKRLQDSLGRLNDLRIHETIARDVVQSDAGAPGNTDRREQAFGVGLLRGSEQAQLPGLTRAAVEAGVELARARRFWRR